MGKRIGLCGDEMAAGRRGESSVPDAERTEGSGQRGESDERPDPEGPTDAAG